MHHSNPEIQYILNYELAIRLSTMNDPNPDYWEAEIENLVQELAERGILSDEKREEIESLLDDGRYVEAGRITVKNTSRTNAFAD